MSTRQLDSRAWVAWGLAAMIPLLLGRNPWVMLEILMIVSAVRLSWIRTLDGRGMSWFIRIAAVFVVISVLFNVLTVRAGSTVIGTLPESWPIIGGNLTLNALVYGAFSGVAFFTLVLIGITVAGLVNWTDLFHALPQRFAPIAVTGSVAWSFLPQLAISWRNIRDAQVMRGHQVRGARGVIPLVTPLLASSLDQSLVMAEVLEARGFGGITPHPRRGHSFAGIVAMTTGLIALAAGVYCLAVGMATWALAGVGIGVVLLAIGMRAGGSLDVRRTRLRDPKWNRSSTIVLLSAGIAAAASIAWSVVSPDQAAFRTYPDLVMPAIKPWLLLALALLLIPAFLPDPPP